MRISSVIVFTVAALFSFGVAAETKIAVVDIYGAIFSSDLAKKRYEQFQTDSSITTLQAKMESTKADIKKLQQEAEKKKLTWSNEEAAEFQKKMDYLRADGELTGRKMQTELKEFENKVVQELNSKAQEALQELLKEEGVTLLLKQEAVWMVAPEMNLTQKLADRLNQKTKQTENQSGK